MAITSVLFGGKINGKIIGNTIVGEFENEPVLPMQVTFTGESEKDSWTMIKSGSKGEGRIFAGTLVSPSDELHYIPDGGTEIVYTVECIVVIPPTKAGIDNIRHMGWFPARVITDDLDEIENGKITIQLTTFRPKYVISLNFFAKDGDLKVPYTGNVRIDETKNTVVMQVFANGSPAIVDPNVFYQLILME